MKKIIFIIISVFYGTFSASAQIPTDSLQAYYGFNSTLLDASGNANHIIAASGSYTTDRFGQPNSAYLFDGVDDSLTIPVPEFSPIQGDFTISFWYKTNSNKVMNLFSSKQFSTDTTNNFEVQLNSHNLFSLEFLQQSWYQTFVYWNGTGLNTNAIAEGSPGFFTKGEWSHFAITRHADTLAIYRNHSLYTLSLNNTYGGDLGDVIPFIFSAAPHKFKGTVDDLRLYNKAFSQAEIDQLWFENKPFQFISPRSTDAYVQNSNPLINWEYNDSLIGDSINVEISINSGPWQPYLPHSHMAYENAFYFDLSIYSIGTTIEFRVTDVSDTSVSQRSATFSISTYDFVSVQTSLPFTARDGAGLLNFQNKLWLLGGWDPPNHPPFNTHSEVLSSVDGANWNFETTAPWPARHCSAWLTDSTYMYVIGGDPQSNCLTDVWRSADGINWTQLEDTIPNYINRNNPNYAIADNQIFIFGGEKCGGPSTGLNEVWQSTNGSTWNQLPNAPWEGRGMQVNSCVDDAGNIWMLGGSNEGDRRAYNDVWRTSDGINWTLVNESAPWGGRYWHSVGWFDQKLWVMAGMLGGNEVNDVWYSEDGITWHELKSTTGNWPANTRHAQSTTVYDNAIWFMCGIATNNSWKIVDVTSTAHVESLKVDNPITIYPNPTSSLVNIRSELETPVGAFVIYNCFGGVVLEGMVSSQNGSIDISHLVSGYYIIKFLENNQSHKLIKY
jgi:hypothetical protein